MAAAPDRRVVKAATGGVWAAGVGPVWGTAWRLSRQTERAWLVPGHLRGRGARASVRNEGGGVGLGSGEVALCYAAQNAAGQAGRGLAAAGGSGRWRAPAPCQ